MKIKIKRIKPMFDGIVTTAHSFTEKEATIGGIIDTNLNGKYKPYQKVISVGNAANQLGIKEGDMIMINFDRFGRAKQKKDVNSVNASREDYHVEMVYEVPVIEMDEKEYLFIATRDIQYIIEDFEELEDETNILVPNNKILL